MCVVLAHYFSRRPNDLCDTLLVNIGKKTISVAWVAEGSSACKEQERSEQGKGGSLPSGDGLVLALRMATSLLLALDARMEESSKVGS